MIQKQKRPTYLNLLKIRLPITGIASIGHRISGALLFLSLPFFVYWFGKSLRSEADFSGVQQVLESPLFKLVLILLIWSVAHHLFAGIRFLLLDMGIGSDLKQARRSAWLVNILGLVVLLISCIGVW